MPAKLHRIKLTEDERHQLEAIRDGKKGKAANTVRALSMLLSDEGSHGPGMKDADIRLTSGMKPSTLERLRKRCCEVGPLGALERKPREAPPTEPKITGEVKASITRLACTEPPAGHVRWTLRLLAGHLVEIEVIDSISHQSVGTVLKKVSLNRGSSKAGASHQSRTPPS